MSLIITTGVIVALLGAAVIGGVFFAFSSFIMNALARVPSSEGIAVMQSINVVVLNRSFLGVFMGTAALSLPLAVMSIVNWNTPAAPYVLCGALLYIVGTFFVTVFGNVPLNNQLEAVVATDSGAITAWEDYLTRWTFWNTVRTIAAMAAVLAFALSLINR